MNLFDGVTGQLISLPFGWGYALTASSRMYARSNFLLTHSTDDIYSGYSTYTRSYSQYSSEFLNGWNGQQDLAVAHQLISGGGVNVLAYNVLYNNFVMKTYGPEYGTYFDIWVGGKTALIMTLPGFLMAWNPNTVTVPVEDGDIEGDILPTNFSLTQNYPNPFNMSTKIEYTIPRRSDVDISILNMLGQNIKTVRQEDQPAGKHSFIWDGTDQSGKAAASGIYFYRVNDGTHSESKKMVLLK